jgi:hypothetical protein
VVSIVRLDDSPPGGIAVQPVLGPVRRLYVFHDVASTGQQCLVEQVVEAGHLGDDNDGKDEDEYDDDDEVGKDEDGNDDDNNRDNDEYDDDDNHEYNDDDNHDMMSMIMIRMLMVMIATSCRSWSPGARVCGCHRRG